MFTSTKIAPSILSADFLNLGAEVADVLEKGADWVHVDVMDGHFVPNLTIGPNHVKALNKRFDAFLDVHLMISNPEIAADWYIDAGADLVCVHLETVTHMNRLASHIHSRDCLVGIALNPSTPVSLLEDIIEDVDMVLIMSVNPGFGGQKFIKNSVRKVESVVEMARRHNVSPLIQLDGGINSETVSAVKEAGADVFVAGSAIFGAPDRAAAIKAIKEA